MDENSSSWPLLGNHNHDGNSFNSLRTTFLSKLPDKVRFCLDSESSFELDQHFSNTTQLTQGISLGILDLLDDKYDLIYYFRFLLVTIFSVVTALSIIIVMVALSIIIVMVDGLVL